MSPADQIEQMIAFGQYWDALRNLDQMIGRDGKHADLRLYRLRAQCQLHIGRTKEAIDDAGIVIKRGSSQEKRNGFLIRGKCYLMLGDFKNSESDAIQSGDVGFQRQVKDAKRNAEEAEKEYNTGNRTRALTLLDSAIQICPQLSKLVIMRTNLAWEQRDFGKCKELTDRIIKDNNDNGRLHYMRGIIYMCDNNFEEARSSLRSSTRQRDAPKNASIALKRITELKKHQGEAQKYFTAKDSKRMAAAIKSINDDIGEFCPAGSQVYQQTDLFQVKLMKIEGRTDDAIQYATKIIDANNENIDMHIERAELLAAKNDLDGAIFDYQFVVSRNQGHRTAQRRLQELQKQKEEESRVDYYGVLGLKKGASIHEVKEAYKKAVRQWHPDKYVDKEKKAHAEEMMKKVNIAMEILGDERKKQVYDAGGDPDNPGYGGGGMNFNPADLFGGGGFPFGFGGGGIDINDLFGGGGDGGGQFFQFGNGNGFHFEMHFG